MIYKTVSKCDFRDEFKRMDRGENFSYEGLGALYDYLEENADMGDGYELDVIALCCDYTESTFEEIKRDYCNKFADDASDDEVLEELKDNTAVIWHDDVNVLYLNW